MRFLRAISILYSFLVCLPGLATADFSAEVTIDLPLHRGPAAHYSVIGYIPKTRSVDVLYCEFSWCKVAYHGHYGWVVPGYLQRRVSYHGPIVRRTDDSWRVHAKIRRPWPNGILWDRDFSSFYPRKGSWFPGYDLYFHKNF